MNPQLLCLMYILGFGADPRELPWLMLCSSFFRANSKEESLLTSSCCERFSLETGEEDGGLNFVAQRLMSKF